MIVAQRVSILCLVCLCITACVFAQTRPELDEFRIVDGDTDKVVYQVQVAADSASRKRGLMYREVLPANEGMLLDYEHSGRMAIWMKNTYISLDIIFIDARGVIVKIHEGAEPYSTKRIESESKVRAVLEVNAGQVQEHDIKIGDQVWHASFAGK